jgi:hypothetical protein
MEQIANLCEKYAVSELAVFGSALREDFRPDSDIDFLVTFENDDSGPWGGKVTDLRDELSALLNRRVDMVPRRAIERSRNWIRRQQVLDSAVPIYGS